MSESSQLLREKRIGIIGAGAMGSALARGLVHAKAVPASSILVSDPHAQHLANLSGSTGVKTTESNARVAKYTDIVILAVKPQTVGSVLKEIREILQPNQLLISIAAGVRISTLENGLANRVPVIRAMPNTAAQVNAGACAFSKGSHADEQHVAYATEIFNSVGTAILLEERMMDAVTALSGSGPAYVYLMIEALVDGGVKVGLPREMAHQLAAQTVLGAAKMVIETGLHPAHLKDMVATPAGTTITALAALEHSGFRAALIDAVEQAAMRSAELGQ
jgi:pyrroline-5-carboxylate reductase